MWGWPGLRNTKAGRGEADIVYCAQVELHRFVPGFDRLVSIVAFDAYYRRRIRKHIDAPRFIVAHVVATVAGDRKPVDDVCRGREIPLGLPHQWIVRVGTEGGDVWYGGVLLVRADENAVGTTL